jgi:hypothetical protein
MTATERVEALHRLYLQLDTLVDADEVEVYGNFLHHLGDLMCASCGKRAEKNLRAEGLRA